MTMLLPLLDDQPDLLAPRVAMLRKRSAARLGNKQLVVSQVWRLVSIGDEWAVYIDDRVRKTTLRFGLTRTSLGTLRRLLPGERAPELDAVTEMVLVDVGILVAEEDDLQLDTEIL